MEKKQNSTFDFDNIKGEYAPGMNTLLKKTVGGSFDAFIKMKVVIFTDYIGGASSLKKKRVLDFGTGSGKFICMLAEMEKDCSYVGTDVSQGMLDQAIENSEGMISFVKSEPNKLDFEDNSFDFIIACCVFHHIPCEHRQENLQELRRVLAPKGTLCIFEHNPYNPVTQYMVKKSPLDIGVTLLSASKLDTFLKTSAFTNITYKNFMFFPPVLKLTKIESMLSPLPLGGQYVAFASK